MVVSSAYWNHLKKFCPKFSRVAWEGWHICCWFALSMWGHVEYNRESMAISLTHWAFSLAHRTFGNSHIDVIRGLWVGLLKIWELSRQVWTKSTIFTNCSSLPGLIVSEKEQVKSWKVLLEGIPHLPLAKMINKCTACKQTCFNILKTKVRNEWKNGEKVFWVFRSCWLRESELKT